MAYDQLVEGILSFVDWGIGIILFLMAWELWKLISISGAKGAAGSVASGLTDWKKSPVLKLANRIRHKGKTRALNEALLEQQELQLVDTVVANHTQLQATVKAVRASLQMNRRDLTALDGQTNALQKSVKTAIGRFRKLNRATLRQEKLYIRSGLFRRITGLSQEGLNTAEIEKVLRDKGIDPKTFMAEEKKLLERHKTARDALQKVRTIIDGSVVAARDVLLRRPELTGAAAWPVAFAKNSSEIDKKLIALENSLDDATLKAEIKIAEDAQHEAMKDMQGILAASRKMWT